MKSVVKFTEPRVRISVCGVKQQTVNRNIFDRNLSPALLVFPALVIILPVVVPSGNMVSLLVAAIYIKQ